MEEQKTELKLIKMSDVQSQEIEWLWFPFIPYGSIPKDFKGWKSILEKKGTR